MAEPIGNASLRAIAWAETVSRRMGMRDSVHKGEAYGHRQNTDALNAEGQERLKQELPHIIQQARVQPLPRHQAEKRHSIPASAELKRSHADPEAILPAPAQNTVLTAGSPGGEVKRQTNENRAVRVMSEKRPESTRDIDIRKVADRVYRLMRYNLVLERERATRIGG